MIRTISILLAFQLAGEVVSRGLDLTVPGPVLGLAALFVLLTARPALAARMAETANGLLSHLSLLFVPAGVGVVGHLDTFGRDGPALLAALVVSTVAAIAVAVGAFLAVARLTGAPDE